MVNFFLYSYLQYYFMDVFNYPNDSFIKITFDWSNLPVLFVEVMIPDYRCEPPAPFYGTYCWKDTWYSDGRKILSSEDLIASATPSVHDGNLFVKNILTLQNSSISVSSELHIYDTVVVSGSFTIESDKLWLHNVILEVVLSSDQEQEIQEDGWIKINGIKTNSVETSKSLFEKVNIVGKTNYSDCGLITQQYLEDGRLVILLEIPNCHAPNYYLIVTLLVFSMLALALLISGIIVYKHQRTISKTIKTMKKKIGTKN